MPSVRENKRVYKLKFPARYADITSTCSVFVYFPFFSFDDFRSTSVLWNHVLLPVFLFAPLSGYLFVHLPIILSAFLSIFLSMSVCLFIFSVSFFFQKQIHENFLIFHIRFNSFPTMSRW